MATAVVHRKAGRGAATYCGMLPGLSYYQPAIPRRPVDRGATDDSMTHFLPTAFDPEAAGLIASAILFKDKLREDAEYDEDGDEVEPESGLATATEHHGLSDEEMEAELDQAEADEASLDKKE